MNCKVEARAMVHPTENLNKVIEALSNIFDYDDLLITENQVTVTGSYSSLIFFKEFLEKQRIRDAARKILLKVLNQDSNKIEFKISKQAAFAGKINLVEDDLSPLGEIEVIIHTENPDELIDWLCPP
ncbi:MAG TPA: hypothetical protein GXZ72_03420 [Methanobacterium sp.]|jgi:predicted RNA binding protein with dsRBD fold (UPF0201 family)|uniref:RNA-binding domain-containing protein n=1 Tax=Methanobacterium sp. MZD130B TaxID=3394378 RepID=UPI0017622F97|nr:hypothetical protein [Methanobacterium sp.]